MAPLIPQNIISGDLYLLFALVIGIAFGFILEQAGFSSSRKLAGVFYGYDFVVLKVFFTAGFTAALGIYFFQYLGWIDIDYTYINPLFTWSAIIGGVIMGFGFILGGFCPGTGFAAAVIGKIDGIIFVVGIFIGVLIFGIFYDFFEPLYFGNPLGRVFVYESLGISQKWFLFLLVCVAVVAFAVTQEIQNRSSKFKELLNHNKLNVKYPLTFLMILTTLALFLPEQRNTFLREKSKNIMAEKIMSQNKNMSVFKLTHSLINNIDDIYLVDVRSFEEYRDFHLPGAVNLPLENISSKQYRHLLQQRNKKTVFYSNGSVKAEKAWFYTQRAGWGDFYVLDGGLNNFFDVIFYGNLAHIKDEELYGYKRRFLEYANKFFSEGKAFEQYQSISGTEQIETIEIDGGC